MQKQQHKPKFSRVYIGVIARVDRAKQIEVCTNAIAQIDGVPVPDRIYEPAEFDLYCRNLRPDEIAVVARLIGIAQKKPPKGKRPGVAFYGRLIQLIQSKAAYILDAHTGIKSTDGQAWRDLLDATGGSVLHGRPIGTEKATELGKLSQEARELGLEAYWKSMQGTDEFNRLASHWRDPIHKNAKAAIASAPDEELRTASPSMWLRIFEGRTAKTTD